MGAEVMAVPCDVTDQQQVETMVRTVLDRYGQIDVLINNAGTIQVGPFEATTLEDYDHALKTHFWAPLFTTLAVYPLMVRRSMGRIVNISSIGGKVSTPHLLPYAASKFALTGFSEGLRAELAKDGVFVTTVIPGLMRTGSPRNALFKSQHRAEYAWFSISDSLPVLSMSAETAARRILDACRHGDAEVILSLPAQLAVRFHGLFPGLSADLLGLVNRVLPGFGGIGTRSAPGRESGSAASPSWATDSHRGSRPPQQRDPGGAGGDLIITASTSVIPNATLTRAQESGNGLRSWTTKDDGVEPPGDVPPIVARTIDARHLQ